MFSITVSMKNKWKISTSLVYVLVIMDNRYNNSNIFFLCLAFSWWHKISCNLVASPKKDLKWSLQFFCFNAQTSWGGFDERFLKGVAIWSLFVFLRALWREKSEPEVRHRQTGNGFQALIDTFSSSWWWAVNPMTGFLGEWHLLLFSSCVLTRKIKTESSTQTGNRKRISSAYWHLFIWESSWWWAVNPASHLRHTNGRAWAWAWVMICWN